MKPQLVKRGAGLNMNSIAKMRDSGLFWRPIDRVARDVVKKKKFRKKIGPKAAMTRCPMCDCPVRVDRLGKHQQRAHPSPVKKDSGVCLDYLYQ